MRGKSLCLGLLSVCTVLIAICNQPGLTQGEIDFEQIAEEAIEEEASDIERRREYIEWSLNHEKRVFNWHHFSSVFIFFVVHFIILLGLYFSYIQFRYSINNKGMDRTPSTMKVGHSEIEISSSIIGLLILVVSLAFFYLYLENVYPVQILPIRDISLEAQVEASE